MITPPLDKKKKYSKNDELTFELTLIGTSIDYLPYFVYTFDELGKTGIGKGRGKFELRDVTEWDGVRFKTIYSSENKTLLRDLGRFDTGKFLSSSVPEKIRAISLRLVTPMRLKFNDALSRRLEFHILFRNLLRRISLLSYFHCGKELNLDFRGLIERAQGVGVKKSNLVWEDWERFSLRQNTKMKMGGSLVLLCLKQFGGVFAFSLY